MHFPHTTAYSAARHLSLSMALAFALPVATAQTTPQTPTSQPAVPIAAASPTANGATVLARGPGGAVITVNDVFSELQRAPEATRQIMMSKPDSIQQLASNLLVRRVLANEAERDALTKDLLIAANVAISRDRALSDARLAKLDAQNAPTEAALEANARSAYQADAAKFEKPAQARVRHILLKKEGPESLTKAQDLLAKLRSGASFEDAAKANSIDTSNASKGGDLGFFSAGQMVRPFEDAVNKLAKPGDLSEPVETQFGYHLIRLEERREKGRQTYDEVKAQLKEEARTAILNESRVSKVQSMMKEVVFERATIEALSKSPAR